MKYEGIRGEPGSYWFVVDLPPLGGKRRQAKRRGFETKAEAHEVRLELLGQARKGEYVPPSRQTLAEYLDEWLSTIESTIRPATHHSYSRNIRLHVIPKIGAIQMQQIDAATLNRLFSGLQAPGSNRSEPQKGLSPRTVRYIAAILHRAFKDAVRWGRLTRNPADAADPPQATGAAARAELRTWTATELASFLRQSAGENDRLHPAWNFLALTGCRRGEALGLRWADVDLQTATASIRQTLIVVNHKPLFGTPKTGAGTRVIDLDKATITSLRSLRKRQLEERLAIGDGWPDHGLVFTHADGRLLHPERFSREFTRRIERYALPVIRLHDLRHTWATLALKSGIHPKVVQERLGHATINVTLDTYSHVTAGMQREAAEMIAAMISGHA